MLSRKGWVIAVAAALLTSGAALAADPPLVRKAPVLAPSFDWSGFYTGGHVGYSRGSTNSALSDPLSPDGRSTFGSLYGGLQVGYNHVFPSGFLVGIEGDVSFPEFFEDGAIMRRPTTLDSEITHQVDYVATLRARFGYVFGNTMVYGTGGFATALTRYLEVPGPVIPQDKILRQHVGWSAGAGAEFALSPEWTARVEYLYDRFNNTSVVFPSGTAVASDFDLHSVRLGLNHFFHSGSASAPPGGDGKTSPWPIAAGDWNVHGQFTLIGQGYPSFRSPYQGQNSLAGSRQFKNTTSATAFVGVRLWDGMEFYVNPELMQGNGLSDTFGLAAYPNGEAQKSGFPYPRLNIARVFVRKTFGLGGEQETIEDGPNQLPGKQDISRITVAAGKMSVIDIFDNNAYSHDPRTNFMNWNMYCCGSYDLTMDKVGYTWGAYAELNQKYWAFRTGYFLVPVVSNDNRFDTNIPDRGEYIAELELRYWVAAQPGKLRLIGWVNRANAGSYAEAVALPMTSPDYPDITLTRRVRNNYGFVVNFEQAVTEDFGLFSRASWGAGQTEKIGWTDTDQALSFGGSLKGTSWGRPNDRIGVSGVIEGLSREARAYFAAGGLGILIGDGALNYRPEKVVEAFYAYSINKVATVTFDYQYFVNPAYNADRGPVSIFTTRLHVEW
jgi:high affinity Mn2+ porin